MTWSIEWSPQALTCWHALSWRSAERVDAAVQRFAATGEGEIFRFASDDALSFRLRVRPHVVRLSLDRGPRIMRIWYVYRQ